MVLVGCVLVGEVVLYHKLSRPVVPPAAPEPTPVPMSALKEEAAVPAGPLPVTVPLPPPAQRPQYTDTFVVLHGEELLYRGESGVAARDAYVAASATWGPVTFWHSGVLRGSKG